MLLGNKGEATTYAQIQCQPAMQCNGTTGRRKGRFPFLADGFQLWKGLLPANMSLHATNMLVLTQQLTVRVGMINGSLWPDTTQGTVCTGLNLVESTAYRLIPFEWKERCTPSDWIRRTVEPICASLKYISAVGFTTV